MTARKIKKIIPYILILAGLIIIVLALYLKISTSYYQNKFVKDYDNYISQLNLVEKTENPSPNLPKDDIIDEIGPGEAEEEQGQVGQEVEEKEDTEETEEEENPVDAYLQGKELSGIIQIPKIGVEAAILEGTDDRALKYTVGHYPGTAGPGQEGNYVLLGHRNYVYGHYFRRLDELEPGDKVIIKKDLDTYTYTVTESFVVSPEEVWVLDSTEEKMLTMITCTPIITYTDRLIVRGLISD